MSFTNIISEISVDLQRPSVSQMIYAKQNDRLTRKVRVSIYNNGEAFSIPTSNVKYIVRAFKPDGTICIYEQDESNADAVSVNGNTATITIAQQAISSAGNVKMELTISNYTESEIITSFSFNILVEASAINGIISGNYFNPPIGGGGEGNVSIITYGETSFSQAMTLFGKGQYLIAKVSYGTDDVWTYYPMIAGELNDGFDFMRVNDNTILKLNSTGWSFGYGNGVRYIDYGMNYSFSELHGAASAGADIRLRYSRFGVNYRLMLSGYEANFLLFTLPIDNGEMIIAKFTGTWSVSIETYGGGT